MIYQIINQEYGYVIKKVIDDKEWFIPVNEANTDYQEYLKWVAEGNEAEEWVNE